MSSVLKILVDIPCEVYCDYELKGEAKPQSIFKMELRKGTYILEFKQEGVVLYSQEYKMQSNDEEDLLKVSLIELRNIIDREEQYKIIENLDVTCRRTDDEKFVLENNNDRTVTPINYSISTSIFNVEFDKCGLLNVNVGGTEDFVNCICDERIDIDGGKWGCINKLGAIQIPIIYDSMVYFNNPNVTAALREDRIVFINKWNEIVFANPYDEVELENAFKWGFCIVAKNGKYGIINDKGTETLPLRYAKIVRHLNTFSIEENGKWGLIDNHCRFITPIMYDSLSVNPRDWNHFYVIIDKREGIIDDKGETIFPLKYDQVLEIDKGFFIVTKENKKGVYKVTGECVLDIKYDDIKEYSVYNRRTHYIFIVSINGKMGIFDDKGEVVLSIIYDTFQDVKYGDFLVEKGDKKGVFKRNELRFILDTIYDDCIRVKLREQFIVTQEGKMGLFDENGDSFFAIEYDNIQEMDHGYFLVEKDGKKGVFVASKQPCILDTIYDSCEKVRRWTNDKELSYFIVSKNGKRGLFDGYGEQMLDIIYDSIDIRTDFIVVIKNGFLIIYSYDGRVLFDKGYQFIPIISEMRVSCAPLLFSATVKRNGKWGCINTAFEEIQYVEDISLIREHIPCEYDKIAYENKEIILESNAVISRYVSYFIKVGINGEHFYYERNYETSKMDLVWVELQKTESKGFFLFFDTETTGVPYNYNAPSSDTKNWPRLVQLAWILTDIKGNEIHRRNLIIKPNGFTIPTDATKIHGITTRTALEKGIALVDAIRQFNEDLNNSSYVVGHNVDFDKKIVGAEMIRLGMKDEVSKKKGCCTMKSTVNFCKIPGKLGFKYPKLQELYKILFGREFNNAHNAMSDVEATKECYFELIKRKIEI